MGPRLELYVSALALAVLISTACSSGSRRSEELPSPSPRPSRSVPALGGPEALAASVCGHAGEVQRTLQRLQATPQPDLQAVTTSLAGLSSSLRKDAAELRASGQGGLADAATSLAAGADSLRALLPAGADLPSIVRGSIAALGAGLKPLVQTLCPTGD